MKEIIQWVENIGIENLRERAENAKLIQQEANTTLTMLVSGAGASLAYAAALKDESDIAIAAVTVSVYFFMLSAWLVWGCLMLGEFPSTWNEPKNLFLPEYPIEKLKEFETRNIQARIEQATTINDKRAAMLNHCRLAISLTPIFAVIAWELCH